VSHRPPDGLLCRPGRTRRSQHRPRSGSRPAEKSNICR
jgi:hypothetical protein